jgi:osmotically-inducible protein OsmY
MSTVIHPPHQAPVPPLVPTDSIQHSVQKALDESPYPEIRHVRCEQQRDTTFLRGSVSCYYSKQLAQETVKNVPGVSHVVNAVEVHPRTKELAPSC